MEVMSSDQWLLVTHQLPIPLRSIGPSSLDSAAAFGLTVKHADGVDFLQPFFTVVAPHMTAARIKRPIPLYGRLCCVFPSKTTYDLRRWPDAAEAPNTVRGVVES